MHCAIINNGVVCYLCLIQCMVSSCHLGALQFNKLNIVSFMKKLCLKIYKNNNLYVRCICHTENGRSSAVLHCETKHSVHTDDSHTACSMHTIYCSSSKRMLVCYSLHTVDSHDVGI